MSMTDRCTNPPPGSWIRPHTPASRGVAAHCAIAERFLIRGL